MLERQFISGFCSFWNAEFTAMENYELESSIVTSTIFKLSVPGEYSEKYHYSRYGNPTRNSLELSLALLDNAKYALTYSSKISVGLAILSVLKAGDRVIFSDILTCEKHKALNKHFEMVCGDFSDLKSVVELFTENTKIVWIETPTIPLLGVLDIKEIADVVHAHSGAILVVDNTLLTSYFQRPLEMGADVTVYSLNEYFGGHDDVEMGAVTTNDENLQQKLEYYRYATGPLPSPFDCYMIHRSLKTLTVRMDQHFKNALAVAKFLETHLKVEKVFRPALTSHKKTDNGVERAFGIVPFRIKGCYKRIQHFFKSSTIRFSNNFGGTESSVVYPWFVYSNFTEKQRISIGVDSNLVIISVGLEDVKDLIAKIDIALGSIE